MSECLGVCGFCYGCGVIWVYDGTSDVWEAVGNLEGVTEAKQ